MIEFDNHLEEFMRSYYFHSPGRRYYGAIRISYRFNSHNGAPIITAWINFDPAGSRAILSHLARSRNSLDHPCFF